MKQILETKGRFWARGALSEAELKRIEDACEGVDKKGYRHPGAENLTKAIGVEVN